ncbi:MAG TPA: rhomboid family intramembrane serine protease [Pseudogracilibacillus sp.]|nr:rhomboid family intramembrane serine protease [Pseudogracilibacillus sp.]
MGVNDQYCLYTLVDYFLRNEDFQLLYMNGKTDEVWLQKQKKQQSTVLRFIQKEFDWKNHLKNDIAKVFQRVMTLKHIFKGKNIEVYNVYINENEPVDEWEMLKKPMLLKEKRKVRMNVFYLSKAHSEQEKTRLFKQFPAKEPSFKEVPNDQTKENAIKMYKQHFLSSLKQKTKEAQNTLSFGKPRMVYLFMLINLFIFLSLEFVGDSTSVSSLMEFGAIYPPLVQEGEWWRLITAMFLHIGWVHLFVNMIALYYLGTVAEKIFGSVRFSMVYILSGLGGAVTSFVFTNAVSAGASGALFGLFGALLYFILRHKHLINGAFKTNLLLIVFINLLLGLVIPNIDLSAHLGGLIFGFISAIVISFPQKKQSVIQVLGFIVYVILFAGLAYYGYILR